MSLVGSLEDLGLEDILQIVSLARKSGLLMLRTDSGEGRIAFANGLVRSAAAKGGAEDLRSLLVDGGHVRQEQYEAAVEASGSQGIDIDQALAESGDLPIEKLMEIRRDHVERAVMQMFKWRSGEFSFDVSDEVEPLDRDFLLSTGLNTQFLAMEAIRLADEDKRAAAEAPQEDTASGAESAVDAVAEEKPAKPAPADDQAPRPTCNSLIVIDPDLDALEWIKSVLSNAFARIHIFQGSDSGIARIRQYLVRGEVPVVLLSARVHPDIAMDTGDLVELVSRLRTQAPRMPLALMYEEGNDRPPECDGVVAVVARPPTEGLGRNPGLEQAAGEALEEALAPWSEKKPG
jgi:hypothetical protein